MQQQDNHEYPFLYQRQTCHQVQPNQATYQKRQKCQPATYLQEVLNNFCHRNKNKNKDGLIKVRKNKTLNGRINTNITHSQHIVIGNKQITLDATGGGFLTASKQFRHGATSKSRSNTASNSTKHKSPHLSGWRQIISLIT